MAKIRDDLVGVVHVGDAVLKAGDTVPRGATVGDHLVDGKPSVRSKGDDSE